MINEHHLHRICDIAFTLHFIAFKSCHARWRMRRRLLSRHYLDQTVMFLRMTDKELRYCSKSLFEVLYDDPGLTPPRLLPDSSASFAFLSMEKLPEVNPDHIFLLVESEEKPDGAIAGRYEARVGASATVRIGGCGGGIREVRQLEVSDMKHIFL